MNAAWFALLLSIQGDGAIITKAKAFVSHGDCLAYQRVTRVRPNQSIGCVHADQIDAIAHAVWDRAASDIWK